MASEGKSGFVVTVACLRAWTLYCRQWAAASSAPIHLHRKMLSHLSGEGHYGGSVLFWNSTCLLPQVRLEGTCRRSWQAKDLGWNQDSRGTRILRSWLYRATFYLMVAVVYGLSAWQNLGIVRQAFGYACEGFFSVG